MKIKELTLEQEAKLPEYLKKGIEIGLATNPDFDEEEVRRLTDDHRKMCGLSKATTFLVYDSPMAVCKQYENCTPSSALYGQHDINWLIHYAFYRNECGLIGETEQIRYLLELASKTGWMWMSSDTTIVTRQAEEIHLKEKNAELAFGINLKVLHNENGMALRYRDGEGLYRLNGIEVPDWLITEPYDIKRVMGIQNTEVRNEGLKLGGPNVLEKAFSPEVIDTDTIAGGGEYALYRININDQVRTYLKGVCPSKGEAFNEAVPPTVRTCREALHWREWGNLPIEVVGGDYLVPEVRT